MDGILTERDNLWQFQFNIVLYILMQEDPNSDQTYEDENIIASIFSKLSENQEVMIGKISITPKHDIPSFGLEIQIRGLYQV